MRFRAIRPLALGLLIMTSAAQFEKASADDPVVFVSSFASGEKGGAIHALRLSLSEGRLTSLGKTTDVENPFFIAVSPDQKFLYAIHAIAFGGKEDEEVAAYAVDKSTGQLSLLNRVSSRGSASCFLEVDATGRTVLVANYSTGSVAALPVKADGSLGEAASFVQHVGGSGVDPKRQDGPYAHSFVVSPNNRFAYAADLGLDQIRCYGLDAETAKLTVLDPPSAAAPAGAGPRHQAFHPNGKWLYAINELANSVTRYGYDAAAGRLTPGATVSTLPQGFDGKSYCADLKITPDGKFLYGTNRGHDSIACYRIGEDGGLTRLAIVPSLGKGPQNLAITADGRWLLCANMPGNNLAVFRIDAGSGALEAVGEPIDIVSPSCIRILE
ncbi:MAG: lactonase family protein [Verrucomicrobiae bacterium]|nr:lactonase family protein [Verrucomicrobiae bacterium]